MDEIMKGGLVAGKRATKPARIYPCVEGECLSYFFFFTIETEDLDSCLILFLGSWGDIFWIVFFCPSESALWEWDDFIILRSKGN